MDYEYNGLTITLEPDDNLINPREGFSNLGTMLCWHRRYNLGDEKPKDYRNDFRDARQIARWLGIARRARVIIPLGLYDHSGLSMYAGGGRHAFDPQGWDSGTVGFIYATHDDILECYGSVDDETLERTRQVLLSEIVEYDKYLTGDVWYYLIESEDGNTLEAVDGFYGYDYAKQEAERAADHYVSEMSNQASYVQWVYA